MTPSSLPHQAIIYLKPINIYIDNLVYKLQIKCEVFNKYQLLKTRLIKVLLIPELRKKLESRCLTKLIEYSVYAASRAKSEIRCYERP
jgi:hypothetical protein